MFKLLKRWFSPPVIANDEEQTRLAGLLNGVLWLTLTVWIIALFFIPWSPQPLLGLEVMLSLIAVAVLGIVALHLGMVRVVAQAVNLVLLIVTAGLVVISGGLQNPEAAGYIVVVMVAGLLSGVATAVVYAFLSLLTVFGIYFLTIQGLLPEPILVIDPYVSGFIILVNLIMVVALLAIALRQTSRAMQRARIKEIEAQQSAQELHNLLASMETTVKERTQSAELARQQAESARVFLESQAWQASGHAQLGEVMRGEQDVATLASRIIQFLCQFLDCTVGALYILDGDELLLISSYAYPHRRALSSRFRFGEGLVGQAALERQIISISNLPEDYMSTASGLIKLAPRMAIAAPFLAGGQVVGVVEVGVVSAFSSEQVDFLNKALESIALALSTAQARGRVNDLLMQTQRQARELQSREEELRQTNAELQEQTAALRISQQRLVAQQDALEAANAELEERASILQEQQAVLDRQNKELKAAQLELEKQARELALASKYKSEFLANMSHELRTPLNSLLILASMLAKNEGENLSPDQVEAAQIIYTSGSDLLALINDILDLSRVEAGKMQFNFSHMSLAGLIQAMRSQFEPLAKEKGLRFEITLADDLPQTVETDQQRIQQIVKNLLSNAFKFTEAGFVRLSIERPAEGVDLSALGLTPERAVVIHVQDSGIGIPPEQQRAVFEAFRQADGSTSRKYGGTGLGLAISRELANRLGGRIDLHSVPGSGSLFSLYIPVSLSTADKKLVEMGPEDTVDAALPVSPSASVDGEVFAQAGTDRPDGADIHPVVGRQPAFSIHMTSLPDDRADLRKGDRILLVIEDDLNFARVVYNHAHTKGFKCLLAGDGEEGLNLVELYHPDAIVLDLKLPGMSGWQVLDTLKQNSDTRHIPVHVLSAMEENLEAYKMGAIGFLSKPVNPDGLENVFEKLESFIARRIRSLLIVEDDDNLRHSVRQLLGGSDVKITEASRGSVALEFLHSQHFDCLILDLNLPDMSGFELLSQINGDDALSRCPVIIYTGKALTEEEDAELMKYADSVIIKGVKSSERLLDETALFLHRVVADMPEEKRSTIKRLHYPDAAILDRQVLIVDDDMRSAFALSKLLTEKGLKVSIARSGIKALELLDANPQIDLVLMDIMMPEMDGYEAIRRIRAQGRFRSLPILALTAKAMKGDREKCIVAGANDYLSKPVDVDRLLSMLRVWLHR